MLVTFPLNKSPILSAKMGVETVEVVVSGSGCEGGFPGNAILWLPSGIEISIHDNFDTSTNFHS